MLKLGCEQDGFKLELGQLSLQESMYACGYLTDLLGVLVCGYEMSRHGLKLNRSSCYDESHCSHHRIHQSREHLHWMENCPAL